MATRIIPVQGLSRPQGCFVFAGDALSGYVENIDTPLGDDGFVDIRITALDTYAIMQLQNANTIHAGLWQDGEAIVWGDGLDVGIDVPFLIPHPTNPALFLSCSALNTLAVLEINPSTLAVSVVATATASGVSSEGTWAGWNADGSRVTAGSSTTVFLFSFNGTALTELDTQAVYPGGSDRAQPVFVPEKELIYCGSANHTEVKLLSYSGDVLSVTDTETVVDTSFTRPSVSPNGAYALQGGRPGIGTSHLWPINEDGTFGTRVDFPDEWNEAVWIGDFRIATIEDDGVGGTMKVRVYSWDGSTLSEIYEDGESVANAQRGWITSTIPVVPPTIQTQFETSYADVSGRDPLPTALQQRTPAQNLVNYLVGLYAGTNPRIVRKPVLVQLGELDKVSPAPPAGKLCREIWIVDPRDPNFKTGRRAVIIGRSGSANPGVVELTLFIADNAASFVEPS